MTASTPLTARSMAAVSASVPAMTVSRSWTWLMRCGLRANATTSFPAANARSMRSLPVAPVDPKTAILVPDIPSVNPHAGP